MLKCAICKHEVRRAQALSGNLIVCDHCTHTLADVALWGYFGGNGQDARKFAARVAETIRREATDHGEAEEVRRRLYAEVENTRTQRGIINVGLSLAELGALIVVHTNGLDGDAQDRHYLGRSVGAALRGAEKVRRAYGAAMNDHAGKGIASRRKR